MTWSQNSSRSPGKRLGQTGLVSCLMMECKQAQFYNRTQSHCRETTNCWLAPANNQYSEAESRNFKAAPCMKGWVGEDALLEKNPTTEVLAVLLREPSRRPCVPFATPSNDPRTLGCQSQSGSGHYLTLVETKWRARAAPRSMCSLSWYSVVQWLVTTPRLKSQFCIYQFSENKDHGIWSHHFMGNRWGNSGNSVRLYFFGLQNHCRWWLQPWN